MIKRIVEPWAVGEYWSSSRPHKKVLVLSQGSDQILMDGAHRSFISWVLKSEQIDRLYAALKAVTPLADANVTQQLSDGAVGMSEDIEAVTAAQELLEELK